MILNFLNMDGHGIFVWSAFVFTMVNFVTLYFIISKNLKKEKISVDNQIRVGGIVKKDSITKENNSLRISFVITDFEEDLLITYEGILPDLFSEEAGIVAKGKINEEGMFIAYEVLAKHDENNMPPEVAKTLKDKK